MSVGTITGILGLGLSSLGGLWYWRITQIAASFAGTTMSGSIDRTAKFALGVVGLGLIVLLIGMAVNFVARDEDR